MWASIVISIAGLAMLVSALPRPIGASSSSSSSSGSSANSLLHQHRRRDDYFLSRLCSDRADVYRKNPEYRGVVCQRTNDHWFSVLNVHVAEKDAYIKHGDQMYVCGYMRADGNESNFYTWTFSASDLCAIWDQGWCNLDEQHIDLLCPSMDSVKMAEFSAQRTRGESTATYWYGGQYYPSIRT